MNRIQKTALFPILTLGLATTLAAQEHDLRVQAAKGTSVWLRHTEKMSQTMDTPQGEMEMGQETTTIAHLTVLDVDAEGVLTVETKVARIQGSRAMPMMGDVEFDSAEDPNDPMAKLAGKSFVAKVKPNGKVAALEGTEELLKKQRGAGAMGMTANISEEMLRSLVETSFGSRPEKPVAVGGEWEHKASGESGMGNAKIVLKLAKVEDGAFEVTGTGTVDLPKPDKGSPQPQMMENIKIGKSSVGGTQRVSRQDGFVEASTMSVDIDATMSHPMMDAEMSVQIKAVTRVERTTASAAKKATKAAAPADAPK